MPAQTLHASMRSAWRAALQSVRKATTGPLSIAIAGSRAIRTAGSFISDGFHPGDEVTLSGFSVAGNNGVTVIEAISADGLEATLRSVASAEVAAAGKTIVADLPARRAFEGQTFTPIARESYVAETFAPISSVPASLGSGGSEEHRLLGTAVLNAPTGYGTASIETLAGAVLDRLKPGTPLVAGGHSGTVIRAERRPITQNLGWLSIPCIITIRALTTR